MDGLERVRKQVSIPSLSSSALIHWTLTRIPGYAHIVSQKGHPALNTSSLTSLLKCHLAPERLCQQWQLSRKEHLRRAATVSPSELMLEACDSLSRKHDFPYASLNIEKSAYFSTPMGKRRTLIFCSRNASVSSL